MNDFLRAVAKFILAFTIGLTALALLLIGLFIPFVFAQL